jgi:hypothetical protein
LFAKRHADVPNWKKMNSKRIPDEAERNPDRDCDPFPDTAFGSVHCCTFSAIVYRAAMHRSFDRLYSRGNSPAARSGCSLLPFLAYNRHL